MKNYLEALTIIQNEISAIGTQQLDTKSVNGVIAEDIFSNNPVPSFSNSAMDGFCLQSELTKNATSDNPVELQQDHYSGPPSQRHLTELELFRKFEGKPL